MKKIWTLVIAAAALMIPVGQAFGEGAPMLLSYQGYMADSLGNPVEGQWTVTFAF